MTAEALYKTAVEKVNENYENANGSVKKEKVVSNYGDYSMLASDYYIRIIRVDNAVLYVTSYSDYQDECKGILKELGF